MKHNNPETGYFTFKPSSEESSPKMKLLPSLVFDYNNNNNNNDNNNVKASLAFTDLLIDIKPGAMHLYALNLIWYIWSIKKTKWIETKTNA